LRKKVDYDREDLEKCTRYRHEYENLYGGQPSKEKTDIGKGWRAFLGGGKTTYADIRKGVCKRKKGAETVRPPALGRLFPGRGKAGFHCRGEKSSINRYQKERLLSKREGTDR